MNLRDLKKEAYELKDLKEQVDKFQDSWIQPIKKNSNLHFTFLDNLEPEIKQEVNLKLKSFHDNLLKVRSAQMVNEKIRHFSRYLIDLKLTTFNDDTKKSEMLTSHLLDDDFLNINDTIDEVKGLESDFNLLKQQYEEINDLVQKNISLESSTMFFDSPHNFHFRSLMRTVERQKKIFRHIGRSFVDLAREVDK